jgi:threonylcarbamoyladenosine tRNA methylthiotransferase MtaB
MVGSSVYGNNKIAVALDSLGCKLNQAEIENLSYELAAAGYDVVSPSEKHDIYILNTCTVTHIADRKSRHMLRMARRRNPAVHLVVIGCYAERKPSDFAAIEAVDLVIDNERKTDLVKILDESFGLSDKPVDTSPDVLKDSRRTRSFIKVQDGCRNFCSYCIVPLVRRHEVSVPAGAVVSRVVARVAAGYKEVVLTGTEIGTYYHDGVDLQGLIKRILDETDIVRLRLSSLQPPEITPDLVGLWRDPRLCPHFHLSLQSGSDSVLRRMKRRYDTAGYRRTVSLIRESVPDVAVTTDIIVGFPGETDDEFAESLEFCREMRFARIHVFPYSPRPGTAAAEMAPAVPANVRKKRSEVMLKLAQDSSLAFRKGYLGRTTDVLWEQKSAGIWSGLTGNYIRVYTKNSQDLVNSLTPVNLEYIYRDGLWGSIT